VVFDGGDLAGVKVAARPPRKLDAACTSADELAKAAVEFFETHPDAEIITSFPGLGSLTGARVLAEIGDDRARFADAKALKSYAGSAPVTRVRQELVRQGPPGPRLSSRPQFDSLNRIGCLIVDAHGIPS
jgi:hypothetical protein